MKQKKELGEHWSMSGLEESSEHEKLTVVPWAYYVGDTR